MIRKDFLLVKIREFAAVLAKIIGFRQSAEYAVSLASVDNTLEQWFGLAPDLWSSMTPEAIENYLADKHHQPEAYDLVGTLLHERGLCLVALSQPKEALAMFALAKYLLASADEQLETFSQDRCDRLDALDLALTASQQN